MLKNYLRQIRQIKKAAVIRLFLVSLSLISLVLILVRFGQPILFTRPKAVSSECTKTITSYYGRWVSTLKMFGQRTMGETQEDTTVANHAYHAVGVAIDKRAGSPSRVYVADAGNNRILGFDSLGTCANHSSIKCTSNSDCLAGEGCTIVTNKNADLVFGQPNFSSASCNGDNNLGVYTTPTARTLCFMSFPLSTNIEESMRRMNFATDSQGNLYVPDSLNNRILKYNDPFNTDKTGGKGDAVADFVIGQINMNSNTISAPSASTIHIGNSWDSSSSLGVSVDAGGNVWVADVFNRRVLRFPPNSKTANLVLGQGALNNFTSNNADCDGVSTKGKFCKPIAVKVSPNGEVYIIDEYAQGWKARIVVYNSAFQESRAFIPKVGGVDFNYNLVKGCNNKCYFQSTGLEINTATGDGYENGKIWVIEGFDYWNMTRVLLLDQDGNIVKRTSTQKEIIVGAPDLYSRGGEESIYQNCGRDLLADFNLDNPGGSIGFDKDNNIYLADESFNRVSRFALQDKSYQYHSYTCPPYANGGLLAGYGYSNRNSVSGYNLTTSGGGLSFSNGSVNQLIVRDRKRFMVWNDYMNKPIGAKADFVVGQSSDTVREGNNALGRLSGSSFHAVDDASRMWTSSEWMGIYIYNLPLVPGSIPIALTTYPNGIDLYWADTDLPIDNGYGAAGFAFDKINKQIWVVDDKNARLLRISKTNYDYFLANPTTRHLKVDMVLGQTSKTASGCNNGKGTGFPTARNFCTPFITKFDNYGNMFVVDNGYECRNDVRNQRILMFEAADLTSASGMFPNLAAKKVFVQSSFTTPNNCGTPRVNEPYSPVSVAFDSHNHMVVGNDGYYSVPTERHYKQLWYYIDPLKKVGGSYVQGQKPDYYIPITLGAAQENFFDKDDNFIVRDGTWNKVWIINLDKDTSWLVPVTTSISR